jgi:hypothetical protein
LQNARLNMARKTDAAQGEARAARKGRDFGTKSHDYHYTKDGVGRVHRATGKVENLAVAAANKDYESRKARAPSAKTPARSAAEKRYEAATGQKANKSQTTKSLHAISGGIEMDNKRLQNKIAGQDVAPASRVATPGAQAPNASRMSALVNQSSVSAHAAQAPAYTSRMDNIRTFGRDMAGLAGEIPRPSLNAISHGLNAIGTIAAAGKAYKETGSKSEALKAAAPGAAASLASPVGHVLGKAGDFLLSGAAGAIEAEAAFTGARPLIGSAMLMSGVMAPMGAGLLLPEIAVGSAGVAGVGLKIAGGALKIAGKAAAPLAAGIGAVSGAMEDTAKPGRGAVRGAVRALDPTGIYNPFGGAGHRWFDKGLGEMAINKVWGGPAKAGEQHASLGNFHQAMTAYKAHAERNKTQATLHGFQIRSVQAAAQAAKGRQLNAEMPA